MTRAQCYPQRCINPLSHRRVSQKIFVLPQDAPCAPFQTKNYASRTVRTAHPTLLLQHPPPKRGCFLSSPGVNPRFTGRQHATRDIQAHFCVHAEILCNSKVNQLIEEYYPAFEAQWSAEGRVLPGYVRQEFDEYLKCGRLEHGFLRVQVESMSTDSRVRTSTVAALPSSRSRQGMATQRN